MRSIIEPNPSPETAVKLHSASKSVMFGIALTCIMVGLTTGVLELAYRFQLLDTYRSELCAYNPHDVINGAWQGQTLLAIGDSFTAGTASYPDVLRSLLPGWRIVNCGIPGTGVVQADIVAPNRLRKFKPTVCVYQIFVGNDLFDIRYPAGGSHVAVARRVYWYLASYLRSLSFLNYRLGQWKSGTPAKYTPFVCGPAKPEIFSIDRYDERERIYLSAEPLLLENQVLVTPARARDYDREIEGLLKLRELCRKSNTMLVLLVIPHAAQVAPVYMDRMMQIGATFTDPERMAAKDYPFLAGIRRAFSNDPGVVIVDPLPALKAAEGQGISVYFTNDGHLNRAGQQRVAQVLVDAITAKTN